MDAMALPLLLYMPSAHGVHATSALSFEPAGPYVPATHGVPLQVFAFWMLLCVPGAQGTQALTTVCMPASHVVLQLWGSSGLLTKYSPIGHDEAVHGSALTVVEKKPMPQGAHAVSAVAVPCSHPSPLMQVRTVNALHCLASLDAENVPSKRPALQRTQEASSAAFVPDTTPEPAGHCKR